MPNRAVDFVKLVTKLVEPYSTEFNVPCQRCGHESEEGLSYQKDGEYLCLGCLLSDLKSR